MTSKASVPVASVPMRSALQPAHLMPLLGATGCKIYRTEQNRARGIQWALTGSVKVTWSHSGSGSTGMFCFNIKEHPCVNAVRDTLPD
jgi:hypothetical protein